METTHKQSLLVAKKNIIKYAIKIASPYYTIHDKLIEQANLIKEKKLLTQEVEEFHKKNINLLQEIHKLNALVQENTALRNLLNAQSDIPAKKITVRIVNRTHDSAGPIVIAQYSDQACTGCLAITESGLLGRVEKIIDNKIFITPMVNKNFRIPVAIGSNMERALVVGNEKPTLTSFEDNINIKENDEVLALDNNGHIIKGIKIGLVKIVNNKYFLQSDNSIKKHKFTTIIIP
ncbi:rod shape-determining protein MreC [Candidatus Xenohaliotis californiensis]|uniref:Cell shape-determining protein MreC n=1 Tax=Candidatus Xenohaliotis californiensis TaxID=84677 RepID=A0ABP0EUG2_9RICK|nr:rod shape-determining protein MreC [Candidatus Xenohaliotis californiensis]